MKIWTRLKSVPGVTLACWTKSVMSINSRCDRVVLESCFSTHEPWRLDQCDPNVCLLQNQLKYRHYTFDNRAHCNPVGFASFTWSGKKTLQRIGIVIIFRFLWLSYTNVFKLLWTHWLSNTLICLVMSSISSICKIY